MLKTRAGDIVGTAPPNQNRFLRIRHVVERTGLPASTIYAKMACGAFPRSIPLGPRVRAWLETEIDAWIDARVAERGDAS